MCTWGWSPDGRTLAYSSGPDLILAHDDGTEPHKLLSTKGVVRVPVWSPNGKFLRFLFSDSLPSRKSTLLEISANGGEPGEVTPNWKEKYSEAFGRWTPDGKYFIFLAGQGRYDIWAVRERPFFLSFRRSEPIRLTSGPVNYGSLAISLDGKKIFTRGIELRGEVERYDPKISQFVPLHPTLSANCCVYSNDGQWLAYVTFPDGNLWRSRPDGTQRQQLTWPPLVALNPHWSPDGREIAFTGFSPGKTWKTFIIPAEGGDPHELTSQDDCPELEANWSPEGTYLTFGSYFISSPSCPLVVLTMDLKTHRVSAIPGSEGLWAPRWSPNGNSIVAQEKASRALMLYDIASKKWSELLRVSPGRSIGFPQWSRDGKLIYYRVLAVGTDDGAYRIRIADRKIEKVADMSGIKTTGVVAGLWTSFDPDGNPLILRDVSLNEIYALDVDLP